MKSARGRNGPSRCALVNRGRLKPSGWRCAMKSCFAPISSGSPANSGQAARKQLNGVSLFGDLPFMVSGDSADVWARQDEFRIDASVGVPPDAFSDTGQDWGLPAYRWDVLARARFRLAAIARPAEGGSVRRLPRRSSRRLLSDVCPPAREWHGHGVFTPADEAGSWRSASGC